MLTALKAERAVDLSRLGQIGQREYKHQRADRVGAEFDAATHQHAPPMAAQHFHDRRLGDLVRALSAVNCGVSPTRARSQTP